VYYFTLSWEWDLKEVADGFLSLDSSVLSNFFGGYADKGWHE